MMSDQESNNAKSALDEGPKPLQGGHSRLAWWESLFKALGAAIALFVAIAGLVSVRCVASEQKALAGEQKALAGGQAALESVQENLSGTQQKIRDRQEGLDYIEHLGMINALRGDCSEPKLVLVSRPTESSFWRLWGEYIKCFNKEMADQEMVDIEMTRQAACAAHGNCDSKFESLHGKNKQFRMPPDIPPPPPNPPTQ